MNFDFSELERVLETYLKKHFSKEILMATIEQQIVDLTTKVDALATAVAAIPTTGTGGATDPAVTEALTTIETGVAAIQAKLPA